MTKDTAFAVIELSFDMRGGYLYVSSKDVPGLHLCGPDPMAVMSDIIPAVKGLMKLNRGLDVEVVPATEVAFLPDPVRSLQPPIGKTVDRLVAFLSQVTVNDQRQAAAV